MCFWSAARYRIYENQPATVIGTFGPTIYTEICPNFRITSYKLLNGKCEQLEIGALSCRLDLAFQVFFSLSLSFLFARQ